MNALGITAACVCVLAAVLAVISRLAAEYYTRQTRRILGGLQEDPKPWFVRVFEGLTRDRGGRS